MVFRQFLFSWLCWWFFFEVWPPRLFSQRNERSRLPLLLVLCFLAFWLSDWCLYLSRFVCCCVVLVVVGSWTHCRFPVVLSCTSRFSACAPVYLFYWPLADYYPAFCRPVAVLPATHVCALCLLVATFGCPSPPGLRFLSELGHGTVYCIFDQSTLVQVLSSYMLVSIASPLPCGQGAMLPGDPRWA